MLVSFRNPDRVLNSNVICPPRMKTQSSPSNNKVRVKAIVENKKQSKVRVDLLDVHECCCCEYELSFCFAPSENFTLYLLVPAFHVFRLVEDILGFYFIKLLFFNVDFIFGWKRFVCMRSTALILRNMGFL